MAVRYSLESAPQGRNDGYVTHNIMAQDDSSGDWVYVPGYHKDFHVPAAEIATVMAMPDSTGTERTAKNVAYKNLLIAYANATPTPLLGPAPPSTTDWTEAGIEQYISDYETWLVTYQDWKDNEFDPIVAASATAASDIDDYIQVTLGQIYPVSFRLDLAL